jgi:hypothetical protein
MCTKSYLVENTCDGNQLLVPHAFLTYDDMNVTYHQQKSNPDLSTMLLLEKISFPRSSQDIGNILQYSQHCNINVLQTEK